MSQIIPIGKVEDTSKVYKHRLQLVKEMGGEEQVVPEKKEADREKETPPVEEGIEETAPVEEVKEPEQESTNEESESKNPEE